MICNMNPFNPFDDCSEPQPPYPPFQYSSPAPIQPCSQCGHLQEELAAAKQKIEEQATQIEEQKREIQNNKQQLSMIEEDHRRTESKLIKEKKFLEEDIEALTKKTAKFKKEKNQAEDDFEDLKKKNSNLVEEVEQLKRDVEYHRREASKKKPPQSEDMGEDDDPWYELKRDLKNKKTAKPQLDDSFDMDDPQVLAQQKLILEELQKRKK